MMASSVEAMGEETKRNLSSPAPASLLSVDVPVENVFGTSERQFWCEFKSESEEPTLAMASADAQVRIWTFSNDANQPFCKHVFKASTEPVLRVTWYPGAGSNLVAAGDASGKIYLWNLDKEGQVESFGAKDSSEQVYALRWCQDGLLVGREDNISLYCHETGKQLLLWKYHAEGEMSLGGSSRNPDNTCFVFDADVNSHQTVAAACSDGTVRTRDMRYLVRDSAVIQPHQSYITSCSYSQNEKYLAVSAGNGEASMWDMRCLDKAVYELPAREKGAVYGALFVPGTEGKQLLTWSQSGMITSWFQGSVTSSTLVHQQTRFPVYSCGFFQNKNNRLLSICGGDGSKSAMALVPGKLYRIPIERYLTMIQLLGTTCALTESYKDLYDVRMRRYAVDEMDETSRSTLQLNMVPRAPWTLGCRICNPRRPSAKLFVLTLCETS